MIFKGQGQGQGQQAGEQSQQLQVGGDLVIVQGLTEQRALEIASHAAQEAIAQYSEESQGIAAERIRKLDIATVAKLARADLLGALADPALQVTLRKAQMGAASSERDDDYELLAGLIEDRAKRASERPVRASINRAVEIVDQVDSTAMAALTVMHAAMQYRPMTGECGDGIAVMAGLMEQLMPTEDLPRGIEWIEHLDVLGAVRVNAAQNWIPFDDFWSQKTLGYVSVGLAADSEELLQATAKMLAVCGSSLSVVDHALKPGYKRLAFPNLDTLVQILDKAHSWPGRLIDEMAAVARDDFRLEQSDASLIPIYMERVRQSPVHARIAEWWEQFPQHFLITPVGRVLARANADRLDTRKMLPPLV